MHACKADPFIFWESGLVFHRQVRLQEDKSLGDHILQKVCTTPASGTRGSTHTYTKVYTYYTHAYTLGIVSQIGITTHMDSIPQDFHIKTMVVEIRVER